MKPGRFWTVFGCCVVAFIITVILAMAFLGALVKPRQCETVQTHENRSVTRCY